MFVSIVDETSLLTVSIMAHAVDMHDSIISVGPVLASLWRCTCEVGVYVHALLHEVEENLAFCGTSSVQAALLGGSEGRISSFD